MARSIGVGGVAMWPAVGLALGALAACGGGSLGSNGGSGGSGGSGGTGGSAGSGACPQPALSCYNECFKDPIPGTCTSQGTWECPSGSSTFYWCPNEGSGGSVGTGGQDGGGTGGAAGSGAAGTSGGAGGSNDGGGAAGITGTITCGDYACMRGSEYCVVQETSTSTQTATYGCATLTAGCAGATDCACLCPNGTCPHVSGELTYICYCSGSSGNLRVTCNGE
jgi:hypothetical protein